MKSTLLNVPLGQIIMLGNYRDVEPVTEKDPDIIELAASIKENNVMQAILLRPGKKPDTYELIFGHRRFVASKVAGKETIPANIMEVPDEKILEIQVTENLQRKDPHPMDEAVAFKSLQKKYKYTAEEIGVRFGKGQDYVLQRIKLNDLIPELQVNFKDKGSTMMLGHALLAARLTKEDQKRLNGSFKKFGTIPQLQDWINREVMRDLSKAPFNTKDKDLLPQAGACTDCPKRSGCQALLFSDIKSPNICMDANCFATKQSIAFKEKLTDTINNKPEILIIKEKYGSGIEKSVNNLLQSMKVKVLEEYDDFKDSEAKYSNHTVKARGLWVSGNKRGTISTIYLKATAKGIKEASAGGGVTTANVAELIKGIKERQARAIVLDTCKVHHAIIDALKVGTEEIAGLKFDDLRPELVNKIHPWQPVDRAIMVYLLLTIAGLENDEIETLPMITAPDGHGYHEEWFKNLGNVTDDQLALIIRITVAARFRNRNLQYGVNERDTPIKLIAEYLGVDTKAIQEAQDQKAAKRKQSADQRIAELTKPPKKAEKTAPAPKLAPMPPNSRAKRAEQAKKPAKKAAPKKKAAVKKAAKKK